VDLHFRHDIMPSRLTPFLATLAVAALGACSSTGGSGTRSSSGYASGMAEPETAVVLLPTSGAGEQMRNGCWASFYDERNFNGDSLTLIGPVELQTLDRGSAKQLKRDIKSIVTGPRATLVVYEKQMLSARSVGFQPDTREGGLAEKLGYGGRIESLRMTCT
jgi:hypothetical protein